MNTPKLTVHSNGDTPTDATIQAQVQLEGDFSTSGVIRSEGDQIAAGISQSQHTHSGVEPGSGTTSTPN